MTFLANAYLWALPLALIPLAIYLLFRRRRQDVPWGPMYILRRVLETRSRLRAWMQYIIILLRTIAIAALALVFAQPAGARFRADANAFPAPSEPVHRVVLLDCSASMGAKHEGGTRLDAALRLCRGIILSGRTPGQLDILPLGSAAKPFSCTAFPVPEASIDEFIASCAVPSGSPDFEKALRAAAAIFRGSPFQQKELYILSDFKASDFKALPEIGGMLRNLQSSGAVIHCLRYSAPQISNFALLDLTANSDLLLARQAALFYVRVGCYGNAPAADTVLTLESDKGTPRAKLLKTQPLSMTPGEKTVVIPLDLPAGLHTITASLSPDDLLADNSLTRSFVVQPQLHVAVVKDLTDARNFDDPFTWLQLALATPQNTDADAAFEVRLQGMVPEQLNADLLQHQDMVIISGVSRIAPDALALLREYVRRGGGVLLGPTPTTPAQDFNKTFAEFAPTMLDAPSFPKIDPERYEQCVAESTTYPLLRELESPEHGNIANPRFYNWFKLKADKPAKDSETLLALSNGAPLLLERRIGRGSVLLWTAGLGGDWNSMVVHPAYPVFLLRFANVAAARRQFPRNIRANEPLLMETTQPKVRVIRPDGQSEIVATVALSEHRFVRYELTHAPGVYEVREDTESERPGVYFTVRNEGVETDLRPLSAEQKTALGEASGAPLLDSESALTSDLAARYPGPSWVLPIALLMLAGLLVEAVLSRWFFA